MISPSHWPWHADASRLESLAGEDESHVMENHSLRRDDRSPRARRRLLPGRAQAALWEGPPEIQVHRAPPFRWARRPARLLEGLLGRTVRLQAGETVTADEAYVRESILNPSAKVVAGFQPIMPTYEGLVTEEQLLELVDYVKSLRAPSGTARR